MSNKKYQKNKEQIKQVYPKLLTRLENPIKPGWLRHIKSGKINNFLVNNIPMYKPDNPLKEPKIYAKNTRFKRSECTIILGIGHGYLLKEIIKKAHKEHIIIIVEPIAYLIKIALEFWDFSDSIKRKRLIIVNTETELQEVISVLDTQMIMVQYQLICADYTLSRKEYIQINLFASNLLNQIQCNTGTIGTAGERMALNDIESIPYVMNKPGVVNLINKYEGKPAVIICTGPSIEKNIHNLINNQSKVVIIAVAQALRMLLAYDIKPDFICTVDFGETNYSHFEELMNSDIPLVALNKTYAPILQEYQGPIYITTNPYNLNDQSLTSIMKHKGAIEGGGSVAHFAFNLAVAMGCGSIALTGQDLSLTDKSHNKQADSMGNIEIDKASGLIKWTVEDKFSNLYGQSYTMGYAQMVPGYFEKPILTNSGLASFITSYEGIFKIIPDTIRIFNCTEGGVHIKGSKRLRLKQYLNKYCAKSIHKLTTKEILKNIKLSDINHKEYALELIKKDIGLLKNIVRYSRKGLSTDIGMRRFINKKNEKEKLKILLDLNFKITRKEVSERVKKLPIMQLLIHSAVRNTHTDEMRTEKSAINLLTNKKQFLINVKRNELILNATKKSAKTLLKAYEQIKNIISKNELTRQPIFSKKSINDLEDYLNIGNFSYPLVYTTEYFKKTALKQIESAAIEQILQKSINLKYAQIKQAKTTQNELEKTEEWELPKVLDLLEESRRIGKIKTLPDAKDLLIEAQKLMPNNQDVLWGLATIHWHLKEWKSGAVLYNKLIKNNPDNLQYQYEKAQFLICTNEKLMIQKGIKELITIMQKTEKYDKAFKPLGNLYLEQKKYDLAKRAFEQYLIKWPHDLEVKAKLEKLNNESR